MQFLLNFAANFTALAITGYAVTIIGASLYMFLYTIGVLFGHYKPDPNLQKFLIESFEIWRWENGALISLGVAIIPFALLGAIKALCADPSANAITVLFR